MTTTLRTIMLISSLALVGWGSAAAEENASDGYTFKLDWKSTTVPLTENAGVKWSDNRQGFGRDNKFYIQDKNSGQKKIHVYDQNGYVEDFGASGLGSNITKDEAGNILVRVAQYLRPYTKNNEIRIIKADGSEYKDLALPEDRPQKRGDYWGFAQGDVFSAEGGKLVIVAANIDYLYVIEFKSGELVQTYSVPMPFLFGTNADVYFSADDYVSCWTDAEGNKRWLVVHRAENPVDVVLDGNSITAKTINTHAFSRYGTSNGMNCFALNGKNYIMFSTQPNWNDGFVIAELNLDDGSVNVVAEHVNDYTDAMGSNISSCCNWLNVEPRDDKSVYVYQYFPGFYMARYIFSADSDDTPLEYIVNEGTVGDTYTIADDIWGIYIAKKEPKRVYAKDLGRHRSPSVIENGQIDYVRQWAHLQTVDWDQSNWVLLDFDTEDEAQRFAGRAGNDFDSHAARVIKGGTLTGVLTDKLNPTMRVTAYTEPQDADEYDENRYVTANFMTPNVQTSPVADYADTPFFFVKPKAQEYVWVKWATYEGETSRHFKVPQQGNVAGLQGGFTVDWSLYPGNYVDDFVEGKTYDFRAIVRYNQPAAPSTRRAQADVREGDYTVFPLEGGEKIITAVTRIDTDAPVVDVTYVNLMGMQASQPFEGVNLVIARHSDGTVTTTKVIGHRQ